MTVMNHLTEQHPTQAPRSWWTFGIVVTVIVLGAGLFFGYRWLSGAGSPSTDTTTTAYPQRITALDIRVTTGKVIVDAGPDDSTTVRTALTWDREKPTVTQQWSGTTLSLSAHCPGGGGRCESDLTVTVPAGTTVTTVTETGDTALTGLTGQVSVATDTGEIRLDGVGGPVTAKTEVGSVVGVGLLATAVTASTETGDLTLRFAVDPQTVSTTVGTGDVTVTVPRSSVGYHVMADTGTGDRRVGVTQDESVDRSIGVRVDTGDVKVDYA